MANLDQVIETIREYEEVFKENSISHYEIVAHQFQGIPLTLKMHHEKFV